MIWRATATEIYKNPQYTLKGHSNKNTQESHTMIWRATATEIHKNPQNDLNGHCNRNMQEPYNKNPTE